MAGTGEGRERPRGFAVDPDGGVWLWDEKGITAPGGQRFEPRGPAGPDGEGAPLRKIRGLSPGPLGELDVLDGAGSRLLRYGPGFELRGEVASFDARPEAIARSIDGTLHVLLPSRRQVVVIAPPRSWSRAVTPGSFRASTIELGVTGPGLTEPVAIALDGLGRLYVLDAASRSVAVLDEAGLLVERAAPARGSEGELRSPEALAVDGEGRVYVADRRQGRVLRFR